MWQRPTTWYVGGGLFALTKFHVSHPSPLTPTQLTLTPPPPPSLMCAQITGRKVAIKRISKVFLDLIDAKRILREIKLLRHLGKHENIVDILDIMTGE